MCICKVLNIYFDYVHLNYESGKKVSKNEILKALCVY